MSAHTPGPWTAGASDKWWGAYVINAGSAHVAIADNGLDARLIAKAPIAPKLAEVLRELLRVCDDWEFFGSERIAREEATAALAEWDAP